MTASDEALGEPYPGLRPFRSDETHIFFGREATIDDMIDRLAAHHFLAVTGLSGSGKSSLVRTGLINALERGLLVEAGSVWRVASMRPGAQPLGHLAQALLTATGRDASLENCALTEAKLARGPLGLAQWLDEIELPERTNLLVLVDQFEEIFRYRDAKAGDAINAFVGLLLASAQFERRRIYVVITMRSDFLGECAQFTNLAEMINVGQFLTPRLTREQCRQAIEEPARVYGGDVEDALVTRLLNDIGGNPDQLPLLQHVLMLLWQRARAATADGGSPLLTLADYERLGGMGESGSSTTAAADEQSGLSHGALSDHADHVLANLTDEQQRLAETLFRALTESEGSGGRDVRHPINLARAAAIAQVPVETLVPIVEAFRAPGVTFLTPLQPEPLEPDTIIDISHESLIRQWVKLRGWVRDEYQSAETYRSLERGAKRWKSGLGNLFTKLDLAVTRKWRATERPNRAWAERYGDAYDLAIEFLRKSERYRLWRRGFATAAVAVPLVLIATAIWFMFYEITVVLVALAYLNPGGEFSDYKTLPQAILRKAEGLDTGTPLTIPGGHVIDTLELRAALNGGTLKGASFVLIEAPGGQTAPKLLPTAQSIDNAGSGGNFQDAHQAKLEAKLKALTHGDRETALVFYSQGSQRWESYNASLRAMYAGYAHVYWYRGGITAWQIADQNAAGVTATSLAKRDMTNLAVDTPTVLASIPYEIAMIGKVLHRLSPWAGNKSTCADPDFSCEEGPSYTTAEITTGNGNAQRYYNRGRLHAAKGEHDDAIADFNQAVALDPQRANYWFARGEAFRVIGDIDDAMANFDRSIALDPGRAPEISAKMSKDTRFAVLFRQHAEDAYQKNDYQQAVANYSKAMQADPRDTAAVRGRGFSYIGMGDYAHALADYDKAIAMNPKDPAAYLARGYTYYAMEKHDQAIADLNESIRLNPNSAVSYRVRGDVYSAKKAPDDAISDYGKAIALNPVDIDALLGRGDAYDSKKDFESAIADYGRALSLDPNSAGAYRRRGQVLGESGSYDRAMDDFRKGLKIAQSGNDAASKQNVDTIARGIGGLAWHFVLKREFAKALEAAEQAIPLAPGATWIRANRAHALLFLGHGDEARTIYLQYRGQPKVMGDKSWDAALRDDFTDLRKAGLTSPVMDEVERQLAEN